MGCPQLLAGVGAPALPTQPLPEEQVRARELGAELGPAEPLDRLAKPEVRVVGPADIAALAARLRTNTAMTGATFDIDGGKQLVDG